MLFSDFHNACFGQVFACFICEEVLFVEGLLYILMVNLNVILSVVIWINSFWHGCSHDGRSLNTFRLWFANAFLVPLTIRGLLLYFFWRHLDCLNYLYTRFNQTLLFRFMNQQGLILFLLRFSKKRFVIVERVDTLRLRFAHMGVQRRWHEKSFFHGILFNDWWATY